MLLRSTGYLQATKEQDKIFALLGLCAGRDHIIQRVATFRIINFQPLFKKLVPTTEVAD